MLQLMPTQRWKLTMIRALLLGVAAFMNVQPLAATVVEHCRKHQVHAQHSGVVSDAVALVNMGHDAMPTPAPPAAPATGYRASHDCPHCPAQQCGRDPLCATSPGSASLLVSESAARTHRAAGAPMRRSALSVPPSHLHQPPTPPPQA